MPTAHKSPDIVGRWSGQVPDKPGVAVGTIGQQKINGPVKSNTCIEVGPVRRGCDLELVGDRCSRAQALAKFTWLFRDPNRRVIDVR